MDPESATKSSAGDAASHGTSSIKTEEVISIVKRTGDSSDYDLICLKEETNDQVKSFQLSSHQASDLPASLRDEFLFHEVPDYLRSGPGRIVHVVVSTGSGTGLALNFYKSALQPLLARLGFTSVGESSDTTNEAAVASAGNSYTLTITQDAQSIRRFAKSLNDSTKLPDVSGIDHTVILLSGDGGTIEMLNGKAAINEAAVSNSSLPLVAMLPLGTGNALFHSLHKPIYASHTSPEPSPLVLGLRTLLKGQQAPLPAFHVGFSSGSRSISYTDPKDKTAAGSNNEIEELTDSISFLYGAIVASYGFHSQLVWESDTPEYRKHGDKRFGMVAGELLKGSHAYNATVEVIPTDGSSPRKIERQQHAYVLATMVSNLEKTFTISPASRPLEGKLRLVHFGAVGGDKTMEIMTQAYNDGNHVGMEWTADDGKTEQVGYDEIKQVKVKTWEEDPRWRKVCIDGTIVEIPQGGSMTVTTEETPHLQVLVDRSLSFP
jgi:diacylglycerol kinase family enzyme